MPRPLASNHLTELLPYQTVTFRKGEIIVGPADDSNDCYVIVTGRVKVYGIRANGDQDTKIIYSGGELFPLTWLLGIKSFGSYFEALTDCTLAKLSQLDVRKAAQDDAAVSNALLSMVLQQFALYASRIDSLSYKYARERLAHRLLYLGLDARPSGAAGGSVLPAMSQQELGSMINLSRESVNRELSRFERIGAIRFDGKRIVIVDDELLRKELRHEQP